MTLVDRVRETAAPRADRTAFSFLVDGEKEIRLSYGELDARARALATLLNREAEPGDRAMLLYPPGLDFVVAFLGCLYGGVIAVPAYPPRRVRFLDRLRATVRDAQPRMALTTSSLLAKIRGRVTRWPELAALRWRTTDAPDPELARHWKPPAIASRTVAFLQYTSGSTADPKGVEVTHGNLWHNEHAMHRAFETSEDDVVVGWLPLYHDMGLIGTVLHPLFVGGGAVLMSPMSFLARPRRWLEAISRHRATISGGPDFAYDLCARKVTDRDGLDLTSWRVAFNGSEPVRAATLERFTAAFAPCGFRRAAFFPCYGLAESTLFVSGGPPAAPPVTRTFDDGKRLVGCGRVAAGTRVLIADPETGERRADGEEGQICVSGPGVARGYWQRPAATARTFAARLDGGRFLRTGDLGRLGGDGELFVTGRLKDLVILRGRNFHPQDLELTAEGSHESLRPRGGAAFSVEAGGSERLVIVHELERRAETRTAEAAAEIRRALAEEHEVEVHAVVLLRAGHLPRTTSGKVRRRACRRAFLDGTLSELWRSVAGEDPGETHLGIPDRQTLLGLPESDRRRAVEELVRRRAARLVGSAAEDVAPRRALALDSLASIELRNRLEADLGLSLDLGELLAGASPAEIASRLLRGLSSPDREPLRAVALEGDLPLSYGQRALWFLYRLRPRSTAYNVAFAARIRTRSGPVDPAALATAFERLVTRHPMLRTTYGERDGEPYQRVGGAAADFKMIDAGPLSADRLATELGEAAYRPFDLDRGPVARARLFRGSGGDVLLFAVHHIAVDFWSLAVLLDDLRRLYRRPLPLPAPEHTYADFVCWQRDFLAAHGERLWAYWHERLGQTPPALPLPLDRPRPAVESDRGASHPFALDGELTGRVRALAAAAEARLFATLLAGLAALLHRYSGQLHFLVGTPVAGRSRAELEDVVGYFADPVPLVADLSGRPRFAELVARAQRVVTAALEHADFPFPLLVERLRPDRDPGRAPLFNVVFVLEQPQRLAAAGVAPLVLGEGGARVELGELELESVALPRRATPFDLVLMTVESGDELPSSLQYNRDLFDPTTAARLARHFAALLASAAADPGRRIGELGLTSAAERHQLLAEWNDTARPLPRRLIPELLAAQAARTPDAVALCGDGGRTLTYARLDAESNRLARHLRALGVAAETAVGLALERSPELVVAILGVLKAGGFYLPLDPGYPAERLAFMLAETRPPVVLTHRALGIAVPAAGLAVVDLDAERKTIARRDARALAPVGPADPARLAYVMYTSGSTGRPKGIAATHAGVVRLVRGTDFAALGAGQVFLLLAPAGFDASTFEIWGALLSGARLAVAPAAAPSLEDLAGLLARQRVSTLWLTAGLFHLMVDEQLAALAPVGELLAGGDVLSAPRVRRVLEALPATRVVNGYGPTEATTFTCCQRLTSPGEVGRAVAIGRPIANTRAEVLGDDLEPVPIGARGELFIAGPGLARGYYGQPGPTAASFVPDPRDPRGGRLYRSGDLVRRGPDGRIGFLGRRDQQVKVRGFRVEPAEIEARLAEHPEVREAVVLARRDALDAYFVPRHRDVDRAPAAGDLRAFLGGRLPAFMIPSRLVAVAALPLGPTGKVDRAALERAAVRRPAELPAAGARSALERTIAAVWEEVLELDEVGRDENFFELGGHSLAMIQAHVRLERALGRELSLVELFSHATVSSLAAHLTAAPRRAVAAEAVAQRAAARRTSMRRRRRKAAARQGGGP